MPTQQSDPAFLAIDTASQSVSVALGHEEGIYCETLPIVQTSSALLGTVESLLDGRGLHLSDLAGLLCTAGPGSFTGIRIGMATIMGLSESLSLPAVALPSLWVQAHWAQTHLVAEETEFSEIASTLAAHRDRFYLQSFRSEEKPSATVRAIGPIATRSRWTAQTVRSGTPVVSSSASLRARLLANGLAVLDPGPLASHLVRLAVQNRAPLSRVASGPSAQRPAAKAQPAKSPAIFSWDSKTLEDPLYALTPAVATRPEPASVAKGA